MILYLSTITVYWGRSFFSHQPYLITHQLYLTSVCYSPVMFHFQRHSRSERQKQRYWQQCFAVKPLSQDVERWTCQEPPWWRMEHWDPVYDKTELKQRKVIVREVFFFFFAVYIQVRICFFLPSMTGFEDPLTKYRRQVYSIYFGAISQPSHEALTVKDWSQFTCSPLHCRHCTNTFLQGKHWDTVHGKSHELHPHAAHSTNICRNSTHPHFDMKWICRQTLFQKGKSTVSFL